MTPQSYGMFRAWLDEEIENAIANMKEQTGLDMNSFGAGYDDGYLSGLRAVRSYFTGDNE